MKKSAPLFLILAAILMASCASKTKDKLYEHIYEGLKAREGMVHPAPEPPPKESPTYGQYKQARKEILKKQHPGQDEPTQ